MKYTTLILDCDGTLTDGRVYQGPRPEDRWLAFSRVDGAGIEKVRDSGVRVIVLSGSDDDCIRARCEVWGIECCCGVKDKLLTAKRMLFVGPGESYDESTWADFDLDKCTEGSLSRCVMVGDDEADVPLMRACGAAFTPEGSWLFHAVDQDGAARYGPLQYVGFTGGDGAVREVCEWVLRQNAEAEDE